jgi:hypothetical protein
VTPNPFAKQREHVREMVGTAALKQSARKRRMVEMRFADLKRHVGFGHPRLRGLPGTSDELLLVAIAQNLKWLVRFLPHGPPPVQAIA